MILTNMIYSENPYIYGVLLISCFYIKQVIYEVFGVNNTPLSFFFFMSGR